MTAGFLDISLDQWPVLMRAASRPLLHELALVDLRYWDLVAERLSVERGQAVAIDEVRPTLRQLCDRWGWITEGGNIPVPRLNKLVSDHDAQRLAKAATNADLAASGAPGE